MTTSPDLRIPSRAEGSRPKSVLIGLVGPCPTSTFGVRVHPASRVAAHISQRRSMNGSPEMVAGGPRDGSVAVDNLPVVPDGEPVEDGHVGRILQGRHVTV